MVRYDIHAIMEGSSYLCTVLVVTLMRLTDADGKIPSLTFSVHVY